MALLISKNINLFSYNPLEENLPIRFQFKNIFFELI